MPLPFPDPEPAPAADRIVVLDVGGTHIRAGLLERGLPRPGLTRRSTDILRRGDPVTALADLVRDMAGSAPVEAVILGLPTSFDRAFETVLSSPNIPSIEGRRIGVELAAVLGCPVRCERDIVLLGMGEWVAGAGRGAPTLLGVFMGTGVGGCFLVEGRPYRGASGGVVEIGHIPIGRDGRVCVCGNRDCLEAYACGHILASLSAEAGLSVDDLFAHPPVAFRPRIDAFVHDFARALAAAVNLMDPHVLVVGGGVPLGPHFPRARLTALLRSHLRRPVPAETLIVEFARLGSEAALHGAAVLAGGPPTAPTTMLPTPPLARSA